MLKIVAWRKNTKIFRERERERERDRER